MEKDFKQRLTKFHVFLSNAINTDGRPNGQNRLKHVLYWI